MSTTEDRDEARRVAARRAYAQRAAYLAHLATLAEADHRAHAAAAGLVARTDYPRGYRTRDGRWLLSLVWVNNAAETPHFEWLIWDTTSVQNQGYPTCHLDLPGALRYAVTSLQDEAGAHRHTARRNAA